jgi:hypothetical protein
VMSRTHLNELPPPPPPPPLPPPRFIVFMSVIAFTAALSRKKPASAGNLRVFYVPCKPCFITDSGSADLQLLSRHHFPKYVFPQDGNLILKYYEIVLNIIFLFLQKLWIIRIKSSLRYQAPIIIARFQICGSGRSQPTSYYFLC